jgi:hypothetical protein
VATTSLVVLFSSSIIPIGGIVFGIVFFYIIKDLDPELKRYLTISSFGIMLFFISGNASMTQVQYPPFGILSISFQGLSSWFLLIGIYFAAIHTVLDRSRKDSDFAFLDLLEKGQRNKNLKSKFPKYKRLFESPSQSKRDDELNSDFHEYKEWLKRRRTESNKENNKTS